MNNIITSCRHFLKDTLGLPFPESLKGNIRQTVCYVGPFRSMPLEFVAKKFLDLGIVGIDLLDPAEWEIVMKTGLAVALSRVPGASGEGLVNGFNHVENHDRLVAIYSELIPHAGQSGVKNLICFSGNQRGKSDDEGIRNCIEGFRRVVPTAEKHGVTLIFELLNRQDHPDYHANRSDFGAEVVRTIGSENFKLLYDIYHMQISEGNLIDTIRKNQDIIGHYHTAGVPGRIDLDGKQEINYPVVMEAIVETGYKGYVSHEFFTNKADIFASIRDAVRLCDV